MKTTLRTLTAWLLFLTLFTAILPCTALAASTPYEINTAEELWQFARRVNGGQTDLDAILMADIVFNENVLDANGALASGDFDSWEPISTASHMAYSGTFDGNGKTISGLYFHDEWTSNVGLFGYIKGGTVQNVHVKDSYFYGDAVVGGIVGCIESGTVIDCSSAATVASGSDYVGGIAGASMPTDGATATVKNCFYTGTINAGGGYVGGIVGFNSATSNGTAIVENCYNAGKKVHGYGTIGGVVGLNEAIYEVSSALVTRCYNTGWVDAFDNFAGGIVGMNKADQGSSKATIQNCYNTGKVTVWSEIAGGIVGENNAWSNSATASIKNCFNIGEIPFYDSCGGIAGLNNAYNDSASVLVENCYYLDDNRFILGGINGFDEAGSAEAKKTAQFSSGEVAYLLGGPFGQNLDNGLPTQEHPVLSKERVYHYLKGYSNHPYGFVVLDESYQNLTVHVDEAGTYSVIFAHYDADGALQEIYVAPLVANQEGDFSASRPVSMAFGVGDNIFLWDSAVNCKPLCNGYQIPQVQ